MGSFGGYKFEGCEIRAVADGIERIIVRGGAFLRLIGCNCGRLRLGEFFRLLLLGLFGLLLNDCLKRSGVLLGIARYPGQAALNGELCDVGVHLIGDEVLCPEQLLGVLAGDRHVQPVLVSLGDHQPGGVVAFVHFNPPNLMLGRT